MSSPQEVIDQARRGPVPAGWRVFTRRRGAVGAFFRGTSGQPDPVLVITPEAAVEYVSDRVPLSATFPGRIEVVQRFVEGCAVHAFWRSLSAGGYGPPGGPAG